MSKHEGRTRRARAGRKEVSPPHTQGQWTDRRGCAWSQQLPFYPELHRSSRECVPWARRHDSSLDSRLRCHRTAFSIRQAHHPPLQSHDDGPSARTPPPLLPPNQPFSTVARLACSSLVAPYASTPVPCCAALSRCHGCPSPPADAAAASGIRPLAVALSWLPLRS